MPKTKRDLEREVDEMLESGQGRGIHAFSDAEIGRMFANRGSGSDDAKVAILGDPAYVRRFRMPKWNTRPTMLEAVEVALRHRDELGIPTSKDAHRRRAAYFQGLRDRFVAEHRRLIRAAEAKHGSSGAILSGGTHEDWPENVRERIRFVAQGQSTLGAAVRLHEQLSKTRSPAFR